MTDNNSKDVVERLEHLLSFGGAFPSIPDVVRALVTLNTKKLTELVAKFRALPDEKRRVYGLMFQVLLSVLENELSKRQRKPNTK